MTRDQLSLLLSNYQQEHLLEYYDLLNNEEKNHFLKQIREVDWDLINHIHITTENKKEQVYEPLEAMNTEHIIKNKEMYHKLGIDAIRSGKLATVLLAGGQGTRLGCNGPKGIVDIGISKPHYIYQQIISNLMESAKDAGTWIPLFIMTSDRTHEQTVDFLKEHQYFDYPEEYIFFYKQDMAPSVDYHGKLLMKTASEINLSPNGNGGWFSSFVNANFLTQLHEYKVEWMNVFSVDNVLQKIADPYYIGAVIDGKYSSAAKVIKKANPDEKIGVLCLESGKPSVIEYYDMTEDMRNNRKADGELSYSYGVILNYLFRLDKLEELIKNDLPIHLVEKKIPYYTLEDGYVEPTFENGYKFETLIVDMIRTFDDCLPYEVIREHEFAPIKNATGVDSIQTARELLIHNGISL